MKQSENIGFGTAAIGRPTYINIKEDVAVRPFSLPEFKKSGLQVLEEAYKEGVRFFDTSPGYGMAEQLLLDWVVKKNDPSITVSTKWGYTYVANFNPDAKIHEVKEHSLDKLDSQWDNAKLLLPYLKVLQIHSATFETGVLENNAILKRLHQLKKENGLVIGLTTTGSNQFAVLEKSLMIKVEGEKLFQSFQGTFNILDQNLISLKDQLSKIEGPFIIKEALANGRLISNTNYSHYNNFYKLMNSLAE